MVFDSQLVTLDTIVNRLEKGGHKIKGHPVYMKINPKDIPLASPSPAAQPLL